MPSPTPSSGSYKLQVRLPEAWREAVALAAEQAGLTVSEFVRSSMAAHLPPLPEVKNGRPKKCETLVDTPSGDA